MLDIHIERERPEESQDEKKAREARQQAELIAIFRRKFPGTAGTHSQWATEANMPISEINACTETPQRGTAVSNLVTAIQHGLGLLKATR
jgi:hypothetical protein